MSTTTKVSFKDRIKAMKLTEFEFVSFRKDFTTPTEDSPERKPLVIFTLAVPIPKVVSSHSEWWPEKNQRVNYFKADVTEVSMELDMIDKFDDDVWEFAEDQDGNLTGAGSYKGDLMLDLSRSERVWLTDAKLSSKSVSWKNGKRSERLAKVFGSK